MMMTCNYQKAGFGLFTMFVDDLIFRETKARPINHYLKAYKPVLSNELKLLAWNLQSRTGLMEEMRTVLPRSEAELLMPLDRLEFSAAASLVELGRESVRFSHQLLQEFFTSQSFEERIASGLKASDLWPMSSWWEASGWDEVAKFAVELHTDPIKFLRWLAEGNPTLAVEIARDQNLIDRRVRLFSGFVDKWVAAITDIDQFRDIRERHAISTALARLDSDKRAGVGLNEVNLPDIAWVDVPKGDFTYGDMDSQTQEYLETF